MKNIVIIKDRNNCLEEINSILESRGFVVHTADSKVPGLDLIRKIIPDLVICSLDMNDMDGHRILLNLKKSPATASIPFIFIAPASSGFDLKGMNLGSNTYLSWPFTTDELLDALKKQLGKKDIITKKLREEIMTENNEFYRTDNFDTVTGLPEEIILENWFENNLRPGESNSKYGLYLIQLDNLTNLIPSLGVHAGEFILQTLAERMNEFIGETGVLFKPEEFDYGILLDIKELNDEKVFSEKLLDAIRNVLNFQGLNLFITGSIGFCLYDSDSDSYSSMKNHAHKALKQAKLNGMNQMVIYSPSIDTLLNLQENLDEYISRAIDENELSMIYQPQASLSNDQITGAEALIRWNLPGYGIIHPAQFIPVAEKTGLIVKLGEWVLKQVVSDLIELSRIFEFPPSISVNISPLQLQEESFLSYLKSLINENLFPPEKLVIEISESMLMTDTKKILKILHKLKELGLKISIDDFGTGFSSLAYIKQFPFNSIKIDKSLIKDLSGKTETSVIRSIIKMAENMKLEIIAEGVESILQKRILKELGCHLFQGYIFSKPIDLMEFSKKYIENKKLQKTF